MPNRLAPLRLSAILAALAVPPCPEVFADGPASPPTSGVDRPARVFSLPIEVVGLPPNAELVPVACGIDFTAILERLGVSGAVDERSLRLLRLGGAGEEVEEPVQFSVASQPRPKGRTTLPDTPPGVSYLGEFRAGSSPAGLRVAGELAWGARGDAEGRARYRLLFGVPGDGLIVQVPFPPRNLRAFDAEG
jgi:hypothetical protein